MKLWWCSHIKQVKHPIVTAAGLKFHKMIYHSDISGYWVELGHLPLYSLASYALPITLNFAI